MKSIIIVSILIVLFTACSEKYLDLDPLDEATENAFFKTPEHFKAASYSLYNNMIGWRRMTNEIMDWGTDLTGTPQDYGNGIVLVENEDEWWDETYLHLRDVNILMRKADQFEGDKAALAEYVAVAKFFRAYHHFILLQRFGGVPIANEVVDLDSEALLGARSSRYEVFNQIYIDLKEAIEDLRAEQAIPAAEKGTISKWAAEAFLAKALLYEATWEKYVKETTDGDGVEFGAGSNKPDGYLTIEAMLTEANTLAKDVMDNGGYELWNKNSDPLMDSASSCYLFNLEDAGSNPGGYEKASNNEFILYTSYDYELYPGKFPISHNTNGKSSASRKFMDMFLCSDGLPVGKSTKFMGYAHVEDEYENRDLRLKSYFADQDTWDTPTDSLIKLTSSSGSRRYEGRKFHAYEWGTYRASRTESQDYPQIRLAEMYLIYAETLWELNGSITDGQLDESINKVKARAGLPALTNAFAAANGLDLYEEIMRERTIELFVENNRYNDLKRLGIAEEMLGEAILGAVIEGTFHENNPSYYNPAVWPYGEVKATTGVGERSVLVVMAAENRNFARTHYLWPLPMEQINLNSNLLQNPGY